MKNEPLIIGWNEWCGLESLGIPAIKAKIDTGAKTSALHAENMREEMVDGKKWIHFDIQPVPKLPTLLVHCFEPVEDEVFVMSSNGHREKRYLIETLLALGPKTWKIKLTLSNRDPLRFRMLIGRGAIQAGTLISANQQLRLGKHSLKSLEKLYLNCS